MTGPSRSSGRTRAWTGWSARRRPCSSCAGWPSTRPRPPSTPLSAPGEQALALGGVGPPRPGRRAVGLVDGAHERVEHAGVVAAAVEGAQSLVELDRVPADEVGDAPD